MNLSSRIVEHIYNYASLMQTHHWLSDITWESLRNICNVKNGKFVIDIFIDEKNWNIAKWKTQHKNNSLFVLAIPFIFRKGSAWCTKITLDHAWFFAFGKPHVQEITWSRRPRLESSYKSVTELHPKRSGASKDNNAIQIRPVSTNRLNSFVSQREILAYLYLRDRQ